MLVSLVPLYAIDYVAAAYWLGRRIIVARRSRALAAIVGVAILRVVALVPVLGGLTWFAATLFGLGLLVLAARPRDRAGSTPAPAAAAA